MNGNCTSVMHSTREIKTKLAHQRKRQVLHYLHHTSGGNHLNDFQTTKIFSVTYSLIMSIWVKICFLVGNIWNFILPSLEYRYSTKDFGIIECAIIGLWDYRCYIEVLKKLLALSIRIKHSYFFFQRFQLQMQKC